MSQGSKINRSPFLPTVPGVWPQGPCVGTSTLRALVIWGGDGQGCLAMDSRGRNQGIRLIIKKVGLL